MLDAEEYISRDDAIRALVDDQMETIYQMVRSERYEDLQAWLEPLLTEALMKDHPNPGDNSKLQNLYNSQLNKDAYIPDDLEDSH